MTRSNGTSVFFVGGLTPRTNGLGARLKRLGISAEHFSAVEPCWEALAARPCDLLVIDLDGSAGVMQLLGDTDPTVARICKLALVHRGDISGAVQAIRKGAANCLEKPIESEVLATEIQSLLSRSDRRRRSARADLTKTEMAVLNLILAGKTNHETAAALHRSPRTVEVHRSHIMRKLGVSGMVDLVRVASALNLFEAADAVDSLHE